MAIQKPNSPLVGYNTNVKHAGYLFHIQTEDSGVDRPHIITHLFTEGTILSTKKTTYNHLLEDGVEELEPQVRVLMKDQHKLMFIELRDGVHDEISSRILGEPIGLVKGEVEVETALEPIPEPVDAEVAVEAEYIETGDVKVIQPAQMAAGSDVSIEENLAAQDRARPHARSIFETPNADGEFGDDFVSDKSLDEVILSYLQDDLDEE